MIRLALPVLAGLALAFTTSALQAQSAKPVPPSTPATRGMVPKGAIKLPEVLKPQDVTRYRRIFRYQEARNFGAANREIKNLGDRTLLGHVYFQRYMGRGYRARYHELKGWMARYADHPEAKRIYKLALRRKPRGAARPRPPVYPAIRGRGAYPARAYAAQTKRPRELSRRHLRRTRWLRRTLRRHIAYNRLDKAERLLASKRIERRLGPALHDLMRARLAFRLLAKGETDKGYEMAKEAAARSGEHVPFANRVAGLGAFRKGEYAEAVTYFTAVAQAGGISSWRTSSAAYWVARSHLRNKEPQKVNRWLDQAAQSARTFYGMLARRQLGLKTNFNWTIPEGSGADIDRLLESPPAVRAIALIQVGENDRAQKELVRLYRGGDASVGAAMMMVAEAGNMPGVSLRVARIMNWRDGRKHDAGLYPVPKWQPKEGFIVDRALVFAVMRQESAFRIRARSRVGARGLMQLMPRTASIVAGDRSLRRRGRNRLYNPELNISLGQKYLDYLNTLPSINGNLLAIVAGYNAGPLASGKWLKEYDHRNDPLMYMESIPYPETRGYTARVMANLWAYRERLGQKPESLDMVAAGKWPIYRPQDGRSTATR